MGEYHDRVNHRPTAVYRLYDAEDRLLYIGVAVDPKRRFRQHAFVKKHWWHLVARKEVEWYPNRPTAEKAEVDAIVRESPFYDKTRNGLADWIRDGNLTIEDWQRMTAPRDPADDPW